jgi:hypothetical protein
MSALPPRFVSTIVAFSVLFRQRTWRAAEALLVGALLAPGRRTVTSVLRVLGLAAERHFVNYHRVLSRAVWSPRRGSRILLGLLVRAFVPTGPVVFGLDDTIERRRGRRICALGIYRDPVRSSQQQFVRVAGLRWLSAMLLAPIPWARRVWALPVLTVLAPSERYARERGRRYKRLTDWTRQVVGQLHRWLPARQLIVVTDGSFAIVALLEALAPVATCITRVRLDAQLYAPAPAPRPGARGRPRRKGARLPSLATQSVDPATRWQSVTLAHWYGAGPRTVALTSGTAVWYSGHALVPVRWVLVRPAPGAALEALVATDLTLAPTAILQYFLQRWQVEVTFEEARRHLGVETQRQWSAPAIARTTPVLLSLVSLVTLLATELARAGCLPVANTAWYHKPTPTFSDALAAVRAALWTSGLATARPPSFANSHADLHRAKSSRRLTAHLVDLLCHAA